MFINETDKDKSSCKVHLLSALERNLVRSCLHGCVYSLCNNHSFTNNEEHLECNF